MGSRSQANFPKTKPEKQVAFDHLTIPPKWYHPLLSHPTSRNTKPIPKVELEALAYDYYLRFQPFFKGQPEGSIQSGVEIAFTKRMRQKLGLAYLFEQKIKLNENYFAKDPSLLPYTLFHELVHIWLYNCYLDPGHTHRFYKKMKQFDQTGLPIDPEVYIHTRVAPEGKFVYGCPNCENRWYLRDQLRYSIYCGHCYDNSGVEHYAILLRCYDEARKGKSAKPGASSRKDR